MDNGSKILTGIFLLAVAISVSVIFYRYVVVEDISYALDEAAFQESLLEE